MKHIKYTCDSCGKAINDIEAQPLYLDINSRGNINKLIGYDHCCDDCRALYYDEINAAVNKIKDMIYGQNNSV